MYPQEIMVDHNFLFTLQKQQNHAVAVMNVEIFIFCSY